MKPFISVLTITVCCFFFNQNLNAQADPSTTTYHVIDYMKVAPDMVQDYLKLEQAWKKIHVAKKKAGKLDDWSLHVVLSPAGDNCEYNYVTRNTFKGSDKLAAFYEGGYLPGNWTSLLTPEEIALVNRTGEIRTIVREEVWSMTDQVMADNLSDAKISVFNFFDFPEGKTHDDHVKMEMDIWKPVHDARVKDGTMKGWVLLQMQFPFGASMPYQDATVDIYTDMKQLMAPFFEKYFGKIHPGKNVDELMEKTTAAATLVKGELRMRIDRLD